MKTLRVIPVALALLLAGCSTGMTPQKQPIVQVKAAYSAYQRFVPMAQHGPDGIGEFDLALDTKTGQLCRTWDWEVPNALKGSNPESLTGLPLCITLYTQYPESGNGK